MNAITIKKHGAKMRRAFSDCREIYEVVFSEAYRSLSVGSRPSLLSRYAPCGVSVVSLIHWKDKVDLREALSLRK